MIGKIKGIGGVGGSSLNVFAQLAEPKVKDGIWIKTEEVITDIPNYLANIPYPFYGGSAVAIGNDIYLFGGGKLTDQLRYAYKYNTITKTYTKLADIPYYFYDGSAVAVGTNIYLFGTDRSNSTEKKLAYKYDTLTDTYTQLTSIPYEFTGGSVVAIGNNIYLFGSHQSLYNQAYKYDIAEDTYTKLKDIPYYFYDGNAVAIGTDIYLFGSKYKTSSIYVYSKYTYKYDTLTNTYTKLTDIPQQFYDGSAIVIDTNIYLLGGNSGSINPKYTYQYDTLTNSYTQLTDIPYPFYNGSAVAIGTDIYLLGGENTNHQQTNYIYNTYKQYPQIDKCKYNQTIIVQSMPTTPENNNIYIIYGSTYATKLLEQMILNFANVFLYKDNEAQLYPIYYGNGTNWIKILN